MTHRKATATVIPIRAQAAPFQEPTLEEILSDPIVEPASFGSWLR